MQWGKEGDAVNVLSEIKNWLGLIKNLKLQFETNSKIIIYSICNWKVMFCFEIHYNPILYKKK